MATIQIKRSTGTSAPSSLAAGELAVTLGTGTAGNLGDRLFIGDGTTVNVIGGKFFSDMLDHDLGTLTASSALTVDSNSAVDDLNVGNNATTGGSIQLKEGTNNGAHHVQLKSPNSLSASVSFTLPDADGTASGQVLKTNGSGTLSFAAVATSELSGTITNAQLAGSIALSKLATTTASRVIETSGTGALQASAITTAELAILDGGTSASTVAVEDADRVVLNDGGTMKQVAVTSLAAYFDDEITAMPNLVTTAATTVGALDSGSITSGFGSIDTGSSTITTTGNLTGGTVIAGDGTGAATVKSNGNHDLQLKSGNSTTGSITITDGANGDITLAPNGTATVKVPSGYKDRSGFTATSLATKEYVDAVKTGLDIKDSVKVATTAAGTLSSSFANGQSVDGVSLSTGDRILIKDQSTGSENGIYTVNASGAPTRATDFDEDAEVSGGAFTFVEQGTANADSGFVLTNNGTVDVGTDAMTFTKFSGAGAITAGAGLGESGTTLSVNVDDSSIEISSDTLQVKALGITNSMIAASTINLTQKVTGTLPTGNGGTGLASYTAGDLVYYASGTALTKLGIGGNGTFLTSDGTAPSWTSTIDGGTF